jgi:hypothetical protein
MFGQIDPLTGLPLASDPYMNADVPQASAPGMRQRVKEGATKGYQSAKNAAQNLGNRIGLDNPASRNLLFNRSAMLGGATITALPSVIDQYQSGNTLGAAATAGTAATGALAAGAIASRVGGAKGALVAGGLSALGGLLAPAVGDQVGKVTGKGDTQGAARTRAEKDAQTAANVNQVLAQSYLDTIISGNKDLMGYSADLNIQNLKRQAPIIKRQLDEALVRQQALNASNAQNYAMLGTVATAGKLATGAQEQAGANFRASISNNPFAGSVLQAPNISFG